MKGPGRVKKKNMPYVILANSKEKEGDGGQKKISQKTDQVLLKRKSI